MRRMTRRALAHQPADPELARHVAPMRGLANVASRTGQGNLEVRAQRGDGSVSSPSSTRRVDG